jgi:DNA-directed RNA polymerase subunit RPC12/RpoP
LPSEIVVGMSLKILCAGCGKDEREPAENAVRRALGRRADSGAWLVSLVKIAGSWSVTLDEPSRGVKSLTLVTPLANLAQAVTNALTKPAASPAPPPSQATPAESRVSVQCEKCRRPFAVFFEAAPDEVQRNAPVACPHCWHVNHIIVAERVAETRDYRTEKE